MDCMTLVRFLYEKIWQDCLAYVQDCKVAFPFCRPGKRSGVLDLMAPLPQPFLPVPYPSASTEAFLPVRHRMLTGHRVFCFLLPG